MTRLAIAGSTTATALLCCVAALVPLRSERLSTDFPEARKDRDLHFSDPSQAANFRTAALQSARVWMSADPSIADLDSNPSDPTGLLSGEFVRCRFLAKAAEGTTPKFRCVLPDGEVVKVKYGHTGEVPAELAATRLLTATGFGADRMYLVPRVRCYGCPAFPFHAMWMLDRFGARDFVANALPTGRYTDFTWAAIERHLEGAEVTVGENDGWAWHELEQVGSANGPARAELDAFRLVARFLSHWDNKAANQRLICQSAVENEDTRCGRSLAYIHDLGATFGPNKLDLEQWERASIWADRAQCRVSMHDFPYGGGTFTDVTISEEGRRLLARQLQALSDAQIDALFRGARFAEFHRAGPAADVREWVRVFKAKVNEIAAAGPCPSPITNRGTLDDSMIHRRAAS